MPIPSQRRRARGTIKHPYSALNLRLLLAGFGLVACVALGVLSWLADLRAIAVILFVVALTAVVDLVIIQRRRAARRREEPEAHHSLFE